MEKSGLIILELFPELKISRGIPQQRPVRIPPSCAIMERVRRVVNDSSPRLLPLRSDKARRMM